MSTIARDSMVEAIRAAGGEIAAVMNPARARFDIAAGKHNGQIIRTWITKPAGYVTLPIREVPGTVKRERRETRIREEDEE